MPTLNANRVGSGIGIGSSNFTTARSNNANSVTDNPTGNNGFAIQDFFSSGRGGGTHKFNRVFIHFDTSGISLTPSTVTLNIEGETNGAADIIVVKSTAMSGDGSTALATSEFFSSIDYSTAYSSEVTTWSTSGNNAISLNATALNDISSNNNFTVALVEYDSDYLNTSNTSDIESGIAFGTTIYLDYSVAASGPADISSINTIAASGISSLNTITYTGIEEINTVS